MTCSTVQVSVSGPVGPILPETRVKRGLRSRQLFHGTDAEFFRHQPKNIVGLGKARDRSQFADALFERALPLHRHFRGNRRVENSRVDISSADHFGILEGAQAEFRRKYSHGGDDVVALFIAKPFYELGGKAPPGVIWEIGHDLQKITVLISLNHTALLPHPSDLRSMALPTEFKTFKQFKPFKTFGTIGTF